MRMMHGIYGLNISGDLFGSTLVVDDFGIKSVGEEYKDHLLDLLNKYYMMETDYNGELYCDITLKRNYEKGYVDISMPNYVHKT